MKKTTRFLAAALALTMSTSMVACGGGKDKKGDLVITASEKGYGLEWLDDIVAAYEADKGIDVQVIKKIGNTGSSAITQEIESLGGDTDIFFSTGSDLYGNFYKGEITAANGQRYDRMFAPLDSIYDTTVEGESKSLREKMDPEALEIYHLGGHYYSTPWHNSILGIVLNVDIFTTLGYTDADIPKTTDEMFALCDDIKTKDAVNGKKVAPFIYSAINEYYTSFFPVWFAQYAGETEFDYYLEGKDPDGQVSEYVYTFKGQEKALEILARLLDIDSGYQHEKSSELDFTDMQGWFLSNQAVFCVNGGWLDIEMANYKSKNMKFIKTPVISSLVDRLSFKTDAELRQVIDFVDAHPNKGDNEGRPSFASEEDVQIVREARQAAYQGGSGGLTLVPSWSQNIDLAKDFLTFMQSDKGLRIYYEATGGGILPMKTSDGVYPEVQMSTFRRNQMEIFTEGFLVNLSKAGTNRLYSIAGVSTTYNNGLLGVPGVLLRTSEGTISERVSRIMTTNQQTVSNKWSSIEPLL